MRIITRYLLREQLLYFAIALFAFTGILLTLRMLRFAALIVNKGVELSQIAMAFFSIIPTFLEIALPLSALLGVMLAIGRLSGDSEIIVLRASGISLYQLLLPTVLFGLSVALVTLYVSNELKAWGFQTLSQTLFDIARSRSTSGLEPGIFNRLGAVTLYAEEVEPFSGRFSRGIIEDRRAEGPPRIIIADEGKIHSNEQAQTITLIMTSGAMHELIDGKYVVTNFRNNYLTLSAAEFFDSGGRSTAKMREMNNDALMAEIARADQGMVSSEERAEDLAQRGLKARLELGLRSAMPFASFLLTLLALPLGVQQPRMHRTWGAALSLVLGLLLFVSYYGLLSVTVALAETGSLSPWLAVWAPNIFCMVLTVLLIHKVSSEQWHSVAEGLEHFFGGLQQSVIAKFRRMQAKGAA
ncbi:MAG: LptF/LptG family permease [Bdellovibrionota bacterium]|nr:MAG: LptF/LptG family permease [Bdellovibrionota bacterium]